MPEHKNPAILLVDSDGTILDRIEFSCPKCTDTETSSHIVGGKRGVDGEYHFTCEGCFGTWGVEEWSGVQF